MRGRWQWPATELRTEAIYRIRNIDQTIVVDVAGIDAGEGSPDEEAIERVNDVGDIKRTVDIAISAVEPTGSYRSEDHHAIDRIRCVCSPTHDNQVIHRTGSDGARPLECGCDGNRRASDGTSIGVIADDEDLCLV